jgi:aminomethyltransferase
MPLYGHELEENIDPYMAGLGFACQCKDRTFVGRDILVERSKEEIEVKRVGLVLEGRRAAREQSACFDMAGNPIGTVTSGSFSPTLQKPIAMAYLSRHAAILGAEIQVDIRGSTSRAWVQELPFYKRANTV